MYLQGLNGQVIKNVTKLLALKPSNIAANTSWLSIVEKLETRFLEETGFLVSPYSSSIDIGAYYLRGNAYYNLGDEQGANEDFQEAIQIESTATSEIYAEDEDGFYVRGLARYRLGNRDGAMPLATTESGIADLQKALEITLKHQNMTLHQKLTDLLKEVNPEV